MSIAQMLPEDVILGNCSTHHSEGGYALAEWLGNLGVEVIYVPELNPIELAFNKLKKIMHQDKKHRVFARNIHEGVCKCLEDLTAEDCRGAPELGSGRVVPAGTLIFARSGSGRNWLKKHGRNRNSVIFRELEYRIYLLNKIDQTD